MSKSKLMGGMLIMFITIPIWFYLLYKILQGINASELVWFLYWVYVPIQIFARILLEIADNDK